MPVGTVKWYDCRKGFGFVIDPTGEDVFVHFTVIQGDGFRRLFDGESVEYDVTRGPKGLLASRVRRLNPERRGKGGVPPKDPPDDNPDTPK